jgi:RNA polymerase-interacting CarD/CdnL/TRCF family regulator
MSVPNSSFELGSVVYEPFLGLCRVISSSPETMLGVEQLFYELQPRQGSAVIKVPAAQMSARGIRPLMSVEQIEGVLTSEQESAPEGDPETGSERLRRWTQLLRSEQKAGAYEFVREWHHLAAQGVRFNSQESEMHVKIQRNLVQEMAQVFQISSGKAVVKLNHWLDPIKGAKAKKK